MPDFATPEEMQTAINSSGYLLEGRVARILADKGFFVEPNCFILDPSDPKKNVEIDVCANLGQFVNEENRDTVTAALLVECKNNSQPFAFFIQQQQLPELNAGRVQYGGYPKFSKEPDSELRPDLRELLAFKEWHHYCKAPEVATQFCSFTLTGEKANNCTAPKKARNCKAEAMEHYSKSFAKLAAVAAADAQQPFGLKLKNIQVQVNYPVVVLQGPIYRVVDEHGSAKVEEVQRLQLQHSANLEGRVVPVQIDVVRESELPSLLTEIEGEMGELRKRIEAMYERLLASAIDQKQAALVKGGAFHFST
ncbi:MAG: hypothetical protein NW208_11200 [Bryobacter sp.]|nr:hypothetical protein [Bryobacter sp.]